MTSGGWVSPDQQWVARTPTVEQPTLQQQFYHITPSGRLEPTVTPEAAAAAEAAMEAVAHTAAEWVPASVVQVPKPRHEWTEAELEAYEQAPHAERHFHRPLDYQLLGPWTSVQIYPGAWCHVKVPLHQYSSAAVRMDLTARAAAAERPGPEHLCRGLGDGWSHLRLRRRSHRPRQDALANDHVMKHSPDYTPGDALWPRLWTDPARPNTSGLKAVEAAWNAKLNTRRIAADFDIPLLPWMEPRSSRSASQQATQHGGPPPRHSVQPLRTLLSLAPPARGALRAARPSLRLT